MTVLQARKVIGGKGEGEALVTRMPFNVTASFSKVPNIIPGWRSVVQDRHHELYKKDVKGKVLVFPACIGSTYTGMMTLQLIYDKVAPAAVVVQAADSLLVSGPILGQAWFGRGFPLVEYPGDDLFEKVKTGDRVVVDGDSGEIRIG